MPRFILRNADNSLQLDMTRQVAKVLGSVTTGPLNGSLQVPGFVDGTPWFYIAADSAEMLVPAPAVSVSGTTISWAGSGSPFRITYGIY